MAAIRIQEAASLRLDDIYRYTRDRWGTEQADRYITGLFAAFDKFESRGIISKPIPAEFGVEGFFFRYERHFVYWRRLAADRGKKARSVSVSVFETVALSPMETYKFVFTV